MKDYQLFNEGSLSHYVSSFKKFPILGHDEEFELALKWKEKNDEKALDALIKSHLRLVNKIAKGYSGYGLSMDDLIAEGNLGIMHAVQHFDPNIGYRFSTYAAWWIKSKMKEFIYNSWSIVKFSASKNNKKLFFNLRKLKASLGIENLSDEDAQSIAEKLDVSTKEVMETNSRFSHKDFSVNAPVSADGTASIQDMMEDHGSSHESTFIDNQEFEYRKKVLHDALNSLSSRERYIVSAHRMQNPTKTLKEISARLDLSQERVRQIDIEAFIKIQKYVRNIEWKSNHTMNTKSHKCAVYFLNVSI